MSNTGKTSITLRTLQENPYLLETYTEPTHLIATKYKADLNEEQGAKVKKAWTTWDVLKALRSLRRSKGQLWVAQALLHKEQLRFFQWNEIPPTVRSRIIKEMEKRKMRVGMETLVRNLNRATSPTQFFVDMFEDEWVLIELGQVNMLGRIKVQAKSKAKFIAKVEGFEAGWREAKKQYHSRYL